MFPSDWTRFLDGSACIVTPKLLGLLLNWLVAKKAWLPCGTHRESTSTQRAASDDESLECLKVARRRPLLLLPTLLLGVMIWTDLLKNALTDMVSWPPSLARNSKVWQLLASTIITLFSKNSDSC